MHTARTTLPNEERPVDPEAAAKVQAILHGEPELAPALTALAGAELTVNEAPPTPPARKRRSDAGTHRPAKPEPAAQPGMLTKEQRLDVGALSEAMENACEAYWRAEEKYDEAKAAYFRYLDSITQH